jgi:multidrug efflux system outer membrane protein
MIRKLLCAGMLLCLGGCNLTPHYTRPEAPVPADWPTGPAYQAQADPSAPVPPDLHWRAFFTDPKLQQVLDLALQNNRDLRLAALNVQRARARYRVQRAELLPIAQTDFTASRQRVQLSGTKGLTTVEQYGLNLGISSWEIDFFGRIRSLSQAALEQYLGTAQARRAAQILLLSEVANAYLTLAADRENLRLAQSTLETQQAAYDVIRKRFEIGLAPQLDVSQAQTRVDAARTDIARYTGQVAQDENALNLLTGSSVPAKLLPKQLDTVPDFREVYASTPSDVLLRRPDILQAENTLKAAYANIGAARASFFPRISLTTATGTASGNLSGLFQAGSFVWSYAPQVVLPVFDARTWSGLKVTKVDQEIAVAQYEKAIQAAFREVADALAKKGTLGNQLAAQKSLVKASEKAYQLSNSRYEKGIDIYLNVLDAQRSLYSAQQGLIAVRLAKLSNQVQLYAVLGGGDAGSLNDEI